MKTYTVIVGRPDYISDNQLDDTYMTTLRAKSVREVQAMAVREAWVQDNQGVSDEEDTIGEPADYVIVAVIEGKHEDIKEWN